MRNNMITGGEIPRLAMMNDIAGFGRCSTTISLPVISAMGVQVCPIPTAVLSNHLGFSKSHCIDLSNQIPEYLLTWQELGFTFDGLYCGFLNNTEQIFFVQTFLEMFHPKFFLLDPVMADHGKYYSGITSKHCQKLQKLLTQATLITPNLTEACLLTDTPWHSGVWTETETSYLCQKLQDICPANFVITGLREQEDASKTEILKNVIYENGVFSSYGCPALYPSRPGTGDLFASILAADLLQGQTLTSSVKKAADFIALCVSQSQTAGVPVSHGVVFEPLIKNLF